MKTFRLSILAILWFTSSFVFGQRIQSVPYQSLPPRAIQYQSDLQPAVDVARLRQRRPTEYLLDKGDTLGVFIEGVLGDSNSSPPVHFPSEGSDLPPATGYPTPVRFDGTISVPLVKPISVRGLTLQQAEDRVKQAYLSGNPPILKSTNRILVTLMRERTYRITVIREDKSYASSRWSAQRSGPVSDRSDQSGRVSIINLPAYKNDVLNALIETGGIPGLNAEPYIRISRASRSSSLLPPSTIKPKQRNFPTDEFPRTHNEQAPNGYQIWKGSSTQPFQNRGRNHQSFRPSYPANSNHETRIPIRVGSEASTRSTGFSNSDIILNEGDVVTVQAQPTEVFYTGGLLGGGEFVLPRDKSLDVLAAIALAGGNLTGGSINSGVAATELIVLRKLAGIQGVNFRVDLREALSNPAARPIVAPGDTLILQYKPQEQLLNFGVRTFNTHGIRRLVR